LPRAGASTRNSKLALQGQLLHLARSPAERRARTPAPSVSEIEHEAGGFRSSGRGWADLLLLRGATRPPHVRPRRGGRSHRSSPSTTHRLGRPCVMAWRWRRSQAEEGALPFSEHLGFRELRYLEIHRHRGLRPPKRSTGPASWIAHHHRCRKAGSVRRLRRPCAVRPPGRRLRALGREAFPWVKRAAGRPAIGA